MKHIKLIETLNERAKKKGIATLNRRIVDGYYTYSHQKKEVYRIDNNEKEINLYHYETLTCTIDKAKKEVTYIYGRSVTDADSIGTFLKVNGIDGYTLGYKPVNGGFYYVHNEKEVCLNNPNL